MASARPWKAMLTTAAKISVMRWNAMIPDSSSSAKTDDPVNTALSDKMRGRCFLDAPLSRGMTRQSAGGPSLRRVELLPGVLHVRDGVELHIGELAVLYFGTAHIDVLDDVARVGIDHDRSARALVLPALEDRHRLVAVEFAVRLFDHIEQRGRAVPAAGREEIGDRPGAIFRVPGGEERRVRGPLPGDGINP